MLYLIYCNKLGVFPFILENKVFYTLYTQWQCVGCFKFCLHIIIIFKWAIFLKSCQNKLRRSPALKQITVSFFISQKFCNHHFISLIVCIAVLIMFQSDPPTCDVQQHTALACWVHIFHCSFFIIRFAQKDIIVLKDPISHFTISFSFPTFSA